METLARDLKIEIETVGRNALNKAWTRAKPVPEACDKIYFIETGEAFVAHGGRKRRLLPGSLHLIPAGTPHSFGCERSFTVRWTHFTAKTLEGVEIGPLLDCELDLPRPSADCERLFEELAGEGLAGVEADLRKQAAIRLLLAEFAKSADAKAFARRLQERGRFKEVFELMDANPSEPPSLPAMARKAGMAPASFSRLFKKVFGESPRRFLMERRLAKAKLLLAGGFRLGEIALELGFSDAFHFSKAFKEVYGVSPSEHRRTATAPLP